MLLRTRSKAFLKLNTLTFKLLIGKKKNWKIFKTFYDMRLKKSCINIFGQKLETNTTQKFV